MPVKAKPSNAKSNAGRKPKLIADEKTIEQIKLLGGLQCSKEEVAAVLGVSRTTLWQFMNANKNVEEAYEDGMLNGKTSLRRAMFNKAVKDKNSTLMIWLSKQHLGMTDKLEETVDAKHQHTHTHTVVADASAQFDAGLDQFLARVGAAGGSAETQGRGRKTH